MADPELTVIPVVEEALTVAKRIIDRGGIRVSKLVHEHEEIVDELLQHQQVTVERVLLNQPVDHAPSIKQEGNTLIIPIIEEILVVEKRLILKEEVRVTTQLVGQRHSQATTVRREEAVIERIKPPTTEEQ